MEDKFEKDEHQPENHEALYVPPAISLAQRRNSPTLSLYIKKNASPKTSVSQKDSLEAGKYANITFSPSKVLKHQRNSKTESESEGTDGNDTSSGSAAVLFKKVRNFASMSTIERKISRNATIEINPQTRTKKISTDSTRMRMEDDIEKMKEIVRNKQKTEQLVSRMLPREVFKQLSEGETVMPQPYDNVTIYFSDIVGFTDLASEMNPMEV